MNSKVIPKYVFIIPHRDREYEKNHYSIYMKYIMEDVNEEEYEIYYSEQPYGLPFNRGATKNLGFLAIKEKYPKDYKNMTIVFNDVDVIPSKKNTLKYETKKGVVKHFYGFTFTLGGIFSINGEDYEKCNGFPNLWGWGIEDNEMQRRVVENGIKIDRNQFYPLNSKEIIHLYDSPNRIISNDSPENYIKRNLQDNLNTIYNYEFKIEEKISESKLLKNKNEFNIKIIKFNTLYPPIKQQLYIQDISKSPKLQINKLGKQNAYNSWNMNKHFLRK